MNAIKRIVMILLIIAGIAVLELGVKAYALDLSAQKAVVIEKSTGCVVFEKNVHQRSGIASTTKIMTAICAIENTDVDAEVKVSYNATSKEGSSMYLKGAEVISLKNLLYGLMLQSGNDAATAIAEFVSDSEEKFALLMNRKAKELGLKNTSFSNPHGLDAENHYSTAYDMAHLARYALNNPIFCEIVSTNKYTVDRQVTGKQVLVNHNKLLRTYKGANGVKTGFTKSVGRCLVSSAEREGVELIAVTLNAPDDWRDHEKMLDYGFSLFERKTVITPGENMGKVSVSDGVSESVSVKCEREVCVTVKKDGQTKIEKRIEEKKLKAPVFVGDVCAKMNVYADGVLVDTANLVAEDEVLATKKSVFKKFFKEIIKNWLMLF